MIAIWHGVGGKIPVWQDSTIQGSECFGYIGKKSVLIGRFVPHMYIVLLLLLAIRGLTFGWSHLPMANGYKQGKELQMGTSWSNV